MKQTTDVGLDLGKWLGGAAAGALLMYLLDPDRGSARRAEATDAVRGARRQGSGVLGNVWDRISDRVSGVVENAGDTASRLAQSAKPDGAADSMGDTVSRMASRASEAISSATGMSGRAADMTSRAADMAGRRMKSMLGDGGPEWTPALRGSAMVGGGLLGLYALMRRSPLSMALGVAGLAMLARGASNQPLTGMLAGRGMGQTIDLEKSIHIDASPEEVYEMWSNYENFPRFMSHVVEVRDLGRGRSHWVVRGPAGSEFEWDSKLTEKSRPHRLAWRSEPGAEIASSGSVQFEPHRGGTRVTVRMSYSPPAGAIGHGIATLLGSDPKRQMDDDLGRMRAFIERGAVPPEGARAGKSSSRYLH
jgi:uncharacterized membrane protein